MKSEILVSKSVTKDSELKLRGHTYSAQIKSRKVFRDGSPNEPDFWKKTSGVIHKDGQVLGTIGALYEYPYAKIKLLLRENSSSLDLEAWKI